MDWMYGFAIGISLANTLELTTLHYVFILNGEDE